MRKSINSIAEIAALAGVSKSTVSRALNDSPLIGLETKERIRAIAAQHHFRFNVAARALSRRSSATVAYVVDPHEDCQDLTDSFGLELMGGAAAGLHELGYDMLLVHADPEDEDWIAAYLDSGRVDGFILMSYEGKAAQVERLLSAGAPFVSWGLGEGRYCSVTGDNRRGGRLAAAELLAKGRRRLAFIGSVGCDPAGEDPEARERRLGFLEALAEAGLDPDPALFVQGDYSEASGEAAIAELLATGLEFDGLFAVSDLMAIAAIRALLARGRRVPEEVSVVGYDDLLISSYVSPALTTIRQGISLAGRILARDLLAHRETGALTTTILPVELIRRASS